ncbi:MAG: septal ring lytic transglycosylase RlpA family protein [Actinobacteria bacterium]|nr:septal ring lytic transglycosylase RlpA family protein [Actinomycetota bacterium]
MPKREFRAAAAAVLLAVSFATSSALSPKVPAQPAPGPGVTLGAAESGDLSPGAAARTRPSAEDGHSALSEPRERNPITVSRSGSRTTYSAETAASWYGPGFQGGETANGERFNQDNLTAAHRTLPFDTVVLVTNLQNGKQVAVRINDRGPFIDGRDIDLSRKAFESIAPLDQGIALVRLDVLQR